MQGFSPGLVVGEPFQSCLGTLTKRNFLSIHWHENNFHNSGYWWSHKYLIMIIDYMDAGYSIQIPKTIPI